MNPLDVFKGVAVLVFMAYHFSVVGWLADPVTGDYGSASVGLFFLVGGFGIGRSLQRRAERERGPAMLARFLRDRAVRIYPLYWAALILSWFFYGKHPSAVQVFGLGSSYWFIGHILQCYLAAPVLSMAASRKRLAVRILPLALIGAINASAFSGIAFVPDGTLAQLVSYRGILLGHVAFFYLGMLAATGRLRFSPLERLEAWQVATLLAAASVAVSSARGEWATVCASMAFMALSAALTAGTAHESMEGPLARWLGFIGKNSLAIYLFEPVFYALMLRAKLLIPGAWSTLASYLALLPVFFAACAAIGRVEARAVARLPFARSRETLRGAKRA